MNLIDNAIFTQSLLERLKAKQKQLAAQLAKEIRRNAIGALADFSGTISTKTQLLAVNKAISQALKLTLDNATLTLIDEIIKTGQVFSELEYKSFKSVIKDNVKQLDAEKVAISIKNTPLSLSGWNGSLNTSEFITSFGVITQQKILNAATVTYAKQGAFAELSLDISSLMDGIANNYSAISQTALQHAYSVSIDDFITLNDDLIDYEIFSSILDNRTSTICRSLDGERFKVGSGPHPPLHPNCRSRRLPVLSDKYQKLTGIETPEQYHKKTYYEWLSTQSAKRQDLILGPARGKLFRDGGIDADTFARLQLNKNFKPLTLDELKKIIPDAFEKANI